MTKLSLKIPTSFSKYGRLFKRYRVVLFILFVTGLGGYLLLQINNAIAVVPADSQTADAPATPHLNQQVVQQLKQLQDNSVSVKALFNQGRDNPFQ